MSADHCTPFSRDCADCVDRDNTPPQAATAGSATSLGASVRASSALDAGVPRRPAVAASVPYDPHVSPEHWIELVDEYEDQVRHFHGTADDYAGLEANLWARVREAVDLMEVITFTQPGYGRFCAYSMLFGHTNADPDAPGATKVMFPALKTHRAIAQKFLPDARDVRS